VDHLGKYLASLLLLGGTALHAGCGGSAGNLLGVAADAPSGVTNEHTMARPVAVAWTSARARRCGFYFDPAKLRSSYLAYETGQGAAGEQLGKIQQSYDTTYKVISDQISSDKDYCSDKKTAEIKTDLQRHMAGDFTPKLPKPKADTGAPCIGFDCGGSKDEKWDTKKFWEDLEKKRR
jgi:hypothetical protein